MHVRQVLVALDHLANALLGGMASETISAKVHRMHYRRTESFINWLFQNPDHCRAAYLSELNRDYQPEEYRNESKG